MYNNLTKFLPLKLFCDKTNTNYDLVLKNIQQKNGLHKFVALTFFNTHINYLEARKNLPEYLRNKTQELAA